jgi:hypothetical protein
LASPRIWRCQAVTGPRRNRGWPFNIDLITKLEPHSRALRQQAAI